LSRDKYRQRVEILRRVEGGGSGGYARDLYAVVSVTSAQVRDESESEWAAAESAQIEHVKTFAMRVRDVRTDDVLRWRGQTYRVRRVDSYLNEGYEIRVRASATKSRYSVRGQNVKN